MIQVKEHDDARVSHVGRKWNSPEGEREVVGTHANGRHLVATNGNHSQMHLVHPDELEGEVSHDEKRHASRAAMQDKVAEGKSKEDAEKSKLHDTDGFAEKHTDMRAQKVRDALNKNVNHGGKVVRTKDLVRERVSSGAKVVEHPKGRRLQGEDGSFHDEKQIGKTGMDYAQHLHEKHSNS